MKVLANADFSMDIEIGNNTFTKRPNVLEELAYRDTWGMGADSFIAMLFERLKLMRDLLADDGCIYGHCDWRLEAYIRLVLEEVFGSDMFMNTLIWQRDSVLQKGQRRMHDSGQERWTQ